MDGRPDRAAKPLRVIVGIMLMAAFVMISFGVLSRYAGAWGVPYFSWTTPGGSSCTNNLTGYVCDQLSVADVASYASPTGLELPTGTKVSSGSYRATHDYALEAQLVVPRAGSAAALAALREEFGACSTTQPSPLERRGLNQVCTMVNGDAVTQSGEPPSRLWVVGTGVQRDGTRLISLSVRSR